LSTKEIEGKGRVTAVNFSPEAAASAAASFSWSKAGFFSRVAASTRTKELPPLTDFRYQKRLVSPTQFARSGTFTASPWSLSRRLLARS
jgi:hypothetical protein